MVYLEFQHVCVSGFNLSFQVASGMHVVVPEIDNPGVSSIIDATLGLVDIAGAEIHLYGQNLRECSASQLRAFRSRVGVISESRGLIANLKVWENVCLPLEYHAGYERGQHEVVTAMLHLAGFKGDPYAAPDRLNNLERKQVLMARAFVNQPELLIVDNLFEGHSSIEKRTLQEALGGYFRQQPETASLFLTAYADELLHLENVQAVFLNHEGEHVL